MTEQPKIAVQSDPRIVRIPSLSGNLFWKTHCNPLEPPNNVSRPTGMRMMMLATNGRYSGFMSESPFVAHWEIFAVSDGTGLLKKGIFAFS